MGCTTSNDTKEIRQPRQKKEGATAQIKKKYRIETKVLGAGAFGKVFLASSIADENFKVAIKVIAKKKIEDDMDQLLDEISILKCLDHPNIVKYYETYENQKYMYIVMEYCSGGELFDVIAAKAKKDGCFNESEAAEMMKKLLKAINHCHSQNIAHRDIKPENILITEEMDLKLIDFGLSKQVKNKKMKTIVGTPYYIAPEVLQGKYGLKWDIWSLGVIMYILLCGYLPFGGSNAADVFEKVSKGEYTFSQKEWLKVSDEGKDLIKNMLMVNTKKRYTAEQCLFHKWFEVAHKIKDDEIQNPLDEDLIKNLTEFKGSSRLKKAAMNLFVKTLNPDNLEKLRKQFELLDENHTGQVDATELQNALKKANVFIPEEQIENIIKEIDAADNKMINYSEFIAATLTTRTLLNENRLMMLFKEFDTDDSGYITKDNLQDAFKKLDRPITKEDIKGILEKHDDSKDGKISYEEFWKMMLGEEQNLVELK